MDFGMPSGACSIALHHGNYPTTFHLLDMFLLKSKMLYAGCRPVRLLPVVRTAARCWHPCPEYPRTIERVTHIVHQGRAPPCRTGGLVHTRQRTPQRIFTDDASHAQGLRSNC